MNPSLENPQEKQKPIQLIHKPKMEQKAFCLTANESDSSGQSVEIPSSDDERSISVEETQSNVGVEERKGFLSNFPSPLAIFSQLKNSLCVGNGSSDQNETNNIEKHATSSKEEDKQESPQSPKIAETEENWDKLFLEKKHNGFAMRRRTTHKDQRTIVNFFGLQTKHCKNICSTLFRRS
ncbi:hypothetical protein niasHT_033747 [Heterodera trifolii]|uniref:Uncharacterized protein n=1 Tax=Heterodera trifolii TaxID=157864 RepID=A0ABD2IHW8_9BILA